MSLQAISGGESWLIGLHSSQPSTQPGFVISAQFGAGRPLPMPNSKALDDLVAEAEAMPSRAAALRAARKTLAEPLHGTQAGLACMRMKAGKSQAQLAELAGTSQAHIARIEAGKNDPGTSLIARIARALDVAEVEVFTAVRSIQAEAESA